MIKLKMKFRNETKTCYRFEYGSREENNLVTLYLKKTDVNAAGINAAKGVTVTVEETAC